MKKKDRQITKIDKGIVSMSRKDYDWFCAEVAGAVGFKMPDLGDGKGRVRIPVWVWQFLLAVIAAALDYSGASMRSAGGCEDCCKRVCRGFGGCDFCFGSACVCGQGDLFECGGGAA